MNNWIKTLLVAAFVVVGVQTSEACSATGMITRADQARGSEEYDTVKSVVTTEISQVEEWTKEEATDAAVGAVMREQADKTNQSPGHWGSASDPLAEYVAGYGWWVENTNNNLGALKNANYVRNLLNEGTRANNSIGHMQQGFVTVRDHATFHGQEWEDGVDRIQGKPLPPWQYDNPDPDPVYHSG
jgi:hypothetical protein